MLGTKTLPRGVAAALAVAVATVLAGAAAHADAYEEDVLFLGHTAASSAPELRAAASSEGLLVRRDNGSSYLLTVGDGCGGLTEGRRITLREVDEPGPARGVVEDAVSGITCVLFECRAVQLVDPEEEEAAAPAELAHVVTALQRGLAILGYQPGDVNGTVGPSTAGALMRYRADKLHDLTGKDLRFTLWTLGMDVLVMQPTDASALAIADTLFGVAEQ